MKNLLNWKNILNNNMAVRVGFEPTVDCYTYGNLANFWFKPLTHLTKIYFYISRSKNKENFFLFFKGFNHYTSGNT